MTLPRDLLTAGCCITYVRGGDLTAIALLMTEEAPVDFPAAAATGLALLDHSGSWTVLLEPNGYQGARLDILPGLSTGGEAVSAVWDSTGRARLRKAANGRLTSSVTTDPAAALTSAEQITGVHLMLDGPLPAVRLDPKVSPLVPGTFANHPALAGLGVLLAGPEAADLPLLAALTAGLVARHTAITDEPAVAEALTARADADGLRPRLGELADRYAAVRDDPATPPDEMQAAFYRFHGVQAVLAALAEDPGEAAWLACYRATSAVGGSFDDQLRLEVLRRLVEAARRDPHSGGS
ncbi:hypothetical protein [Actinoplanes sp. NPDC049599]|uniref:hypothetical protein n=1 Tax=Actinoplanes sp. NPDC049599 TaxID=3363903 RepID=UPI0037AA3E3A